MRPHLGKGMILIGALFFCSCTKDQNRAEINTVSGPIDQEQIGLTFTHEHIMSNFGGDIGDALEYDTARLFDQVIPYLQKLKKAGVSTIFDCTTEYFGRRADLLKIMSESSGIRIVTNTGFYAAAEDRYVPPFAFDADIQDISQVWVDEFNHGIKGSDIKPGFVKLAFDDGLPSNIDKKLFEAGILTHLATGLTLAVHTGDNIDAAAYQAQRLKEQGVALNAWIWTHAHKIKEDDVLLRFATEGAWISLDGIKKNNIMENIARLRLFKSQGLLSKVLLSHDGNGFPRGGEIREFEAIVYDLIPKMLESGFDQDDLDQLLKRNPIEAFAPRVRRAIGQ